MRSYYSTPLGGGQWFRDTGSVSLSEVREVPCQPEAGLGRPQGQLLSLRALEPHRHVPIEIEKHKLVAVLDHLEALAPARFGAQVVAVVVAVEPPTPLDQHRAVRGDGNGLVRPKGDDDLRAALRGAEGACLSAPAAACPP